MPSFEIHIYFYFSHAVLDKDYFEHIPKGFFFDKVIQVD